MVPEALPPHSTLQGETIQHLREVMNISRAEGLPIFGKYLYDIGCRQIGGPAELCSIFETLTSKIRSFAISLHTEEEAMVIHKAFLFSHHDDANVDQWASNLMDVIACNYMTIISRRPPSSFELA
jgi:hypothetical protein